MSLLVPLAIGAAALGGIALLARNAKADGSTSREMWLINGTTYTITHHIVGPGWAPELYPGFCNLTTPNIVQEGPGWGVVQFQAQWCAANRLFEVPESMSISEV